MRIHFAAMAAVAVVCTASSAMAGTIADWTFETLPASPAVITAGPYAPEVGAGAATGSHAAVSTYSTPAGNGSVHSYSSNQWAIGDYYQFQVSTLGQSQIGLVFDQTSSATGPRDFKVQYSTNGTTFTDAGFSYSVLANASPNPLWSTTVPAVGYTKFADLSTIPAVENKPAVYLRLVLTSLVPAGPTSTFGSGGTDRVDNVMVLSQVPEPGSMLLVMSCIAGLGFVRRGSR